MQDKSSDLPAQPGTISALSNGWRGLKANFLIFFLAALAVALLYSPQYGEKAVVDGQVMQPSAFYGFMLTAYFILFLPVIKYGADLIFLRGVRGDGVKVKIIIEGFNNYLNVILASLLAFGLVGIATIAFIIPGIYVACRLAFVSYLVMDEGLDPIEAVEASWRITKGHVWKIFLLGLASVLLFFLGFALLFVGSIFACMWAKASFAAMYLLITQSGSESG